MLTKGAIGNLVNRYRAVLQKCNLLNTFGSLAVASMLVLGGAAGAMAANVDLGTIDQTAAYTYSPVNHNDVISGNVKADAGFIFQGNNVQTFHGTQMNAVIDTDQLSIIGSSTQATGFAVSSNDTLAAVDKIYIECNGQRTGIKFTGSDLDIKAPIVLSRNSDDQDARFEITPNSSVKLSSVTVEKGLGGLQINHTGELEVDLLHIKSGATMKLETYRDPTLSDPTGAFYTIGKIQADKDSLFNIAVYNDDQPAVHIQNFDGKSLDIEVEEGATVDLGAMTKGDRRGNKMFINADEINVTVKSVEEKMPRVYLSNNNDCLKDTKINVISAGENNSGNATADLGKLVDVVQKTKESNEVGELPTTSLADGAQLTQLASDIYDEATGTVTVNADGTGTVTNIKIVSNPNINGIAEMNAVGLHIWRNEINDMNKRLGDLRASKNAKHGVWTRVYNGKARFGSQDITNKYTAVQLGYDQQVMPGFWLGGAFSYTGGDSDFAHGDGDNDLLAFTAYGSYLAENGVFLDLTAKYGFMTNEFDIALADGTRSKGDYSNNAISFSAELGWHKPFSCGLFIEPQVEMMYGFVDDVSYTTSTGVDVKQDATTTFIGRVGLALGYKFGDFGSAYVRASALRDFAGEAEYSFSKNGGAPRHLSEDLGDSWFEFGMGANCKVTDNIHTYVDLETSHGGEVETDYRVNVGLRYTF